MPETTPDPTPESTIEPAERPVDRKLLELLVCPVTKTTLEYDADARELISRTAKLAYPIRNGIPIMLPDEARALED
ncbi:MULTISPECIES: Trm112 family protein [unclassified Roseibium]|uniref:Trm112 family protein n=1 Tax=unclassified Roseibium TaxID=2629323 RepID=UPI00317E5DD7